MRFLAKIVSLILVTLWFPATQHCALEAAEIGFFSHADHESPCADGCAEDVCPTVEDGAYFKTASSVKVLPPACSVSLDLLSLLSALAPEDDAAARLVHEPPAVLVLHRTWQFVRRLACPPRAPGLVAA